MTKVSEWIQGARQSPAAAAEVRHDILWLRAVAVEGLFCFHCSRFFDYFGWPVGGGALGSLIHALTVVLGLWVMPLLSVVRGVTAALAMWRRTARQFVRDGARRLLPPMALAVLVLVPPQIYLERLASSQPAGWFLVFYPSYLGAILPSGGGSGLAGTHRWYLLVLFGFSVLLVPLSLLVRSATGRRLHGRGVTPFARPAMILSLGLPLMALGLARRSDIIGAPWLDGSSLMGYLVLFICGYLLLSNERVRAAVNEVGPYTVLLALLGTPTAVCVCSPGQVPAAGAGDCSAGLGLVAFVSWCRVLGLLHIGQCYLNRTNGTLHWLNQAVMPFYVLHQTVIVAVGYYAVQSTLPAAAKYAALWAISLAIAVAVCEFAVRRFAPLSALFGLSVVDTEEWPTSAMPAPAR